VAVATLAQMNARGDVHLSRILRVCTMLETQLRVVPWKVE